MRLPSQLPYNSQPGYERRRQFQPNIDIKRKGGFKGDSDLTLQMTLTNMHIASHPTDSKAIDYLSKLKTLEYICHQPGGYIIESQLKSPEDIFERFRKYNI